MLRRHQKQVEGLSNAAESHFDNNFIARLERLIDVQRFVFGWLFLLVTLVVVVIFQIIGLNQYYLKRGPVAGGVLNEGMVGSFNNINPLYATGLVDQGLSHLVFAGLLRYNTEGQLVGDLASGYDIDESGKVYTVHLRPGLVWHDGKPLTSKDVAFTYATIQNADAKSPLLSSWQGISVTAPSALTVVFQLPGALTAFPSGLTLGIIPHHILSTVPVSQLRTSSFNTARPVGAGPFTWDALQLGNTVDTNTATATISLKQFKQYHGKPALLNGMVIHVYDADEKAINAYRKHVIETIAGLKSVPAALEENTANYIYRFPLAAENMLFFKTSEGLLSEAALRQALVRATDQSALLAALGHNVKPVKEPLLKGQLGYDKAYEQASFNPVAAASLLDQAGWTKGKSGMRSKNGTPLRIPVVAEDTEENRLILIKIADMWRAVGAVMEMSFQQKTDFQSTVETHQYVGLLYGITIGFDPDVFVYWDSSQTDARSANHLNFSEYKSTVADAALAAGRTRQDPLVRALKYKPFLKAWQEDAPAMGLFQPNALYVSRGKIAGLTEHTLTSDADRYYSVADWSVKTGNIPQ